jgi:hypothetical protein
MFSIHVISLIVCSAAFLLTIVFSQTANTVSSHDSALILFGLSDIFNAVTLISQLAGFLVVSYVMLPIT